jgi:hypothetical protein
MTDLESFAIGGFIELDGTKLHLTPLTALDFAEARAFVRSLSEDPMNGMVEVSNSLHPEVAKVLMTEVYRSREKWGSLTEGFGAMWASGWEGQAFFLYKASRTHHSDLTHDWFKAAVMRHSEKQREEVMNRLADISGLTPDPTSTPKPTAKKKKRRTR